MNCANCVYRPYSKMKPPVPSSYEVAVIGEAPGATEIAKGQCFIGTSGDLLRTTMKRVGIDDKSVYFSNALMCLPPRGKPIKREGVMQCRERLIHELEVVQPRLIIVLGNSAMHSVTGDFTLKISMEQGRVMACPELPSVPVIPITHPAAILRSPGAYKIFHRLMGYAAEVLHKGEILDPGVTEYQIISTPEQVQEAQRTLDQYKGTERLLVGADIETTGLDCRTDRILVIGLAYDKNKAFVFIPSVFQYIHDILSNERYQFIWQNGKFDNGFLKRRGYKSRVDHDTLLGHYGLNENSGTHDLEQLAVQYIGARPYKSTAGKYINSEGGFKSAPLEVQAQRVATDADYTRQIFNQIYPKIVSDENLNKLYHNILIPGSEFLRQVERRGILIDIPCMEKLAIQYEHKIQNLKDQITQSFDSVWSKETYMRQTGAKSAEDHFKPTSTKQLAWLVFDRLKLKPSIKKKRSTDEEVLLSLGRGRTEEEKMYDLRQKYPSIASILDLRSLNKELGTYVIGFLKRLDKEGRVHSTFNLHRTSTGRLSSSDPGVQNIPHERLDVRRGFIAPPGYELIEADYKGAELRVLAHESKDQFLMEVFQQGRDLHSEVAIKLFGPEYTHGDRMKAKTVNFGKCIAELKSLSYR